MKSVIKPELRLSSDCLGEQVRRRLPDPQGQAHGPGPGPPHPWRAKSLDLELHLLHGVGSHIHPGWTWSSISMASVASSQPRARPTMPSACRQGCWPMCLGAETHKKLCIWFGFSRLGCWPIRCASERRRTNSSACSSSHLVSFFRLGGNCST